MSSQTIMVVLVKTKLEIINYEQLLDQFWSDGTADRELQIPMRLEKYALVKPRGPGHQSWLA